MTMLTISQLTYSTPTLAQAMRACMLCAGLSRASGSRAFVLGNPRAWLGTAYHEVLEDLPVLVSSGGSDLFQLAESRWSHAIARLEQEAASHPLNHRFGAGPTWKGYYLVLETLRIRVSELAGAIAPRSEQESVDGGPRATSALREAEFSADSGKLRGRIDLVRGDEIVDYKTGALFDADTGGGSPTVKDVYVRQLRIYAYLVHAATGCWPRRGLLYPLAGPPVMVELEPHACEAEASEAVALLDRYNSVIANGGDPSKLASPSCEACRWCPFKAVCPAFWMAAKDSWAGTLDGEAIAGELTKPPQPVHGGAAWSIALMVDAGTVASGEVVISPLNATVYPAVSHLSQGERVRIIGLGRRANGALFPTQRTVVVREADVPLIDLG
jgi:RecB family exonuclease